MQSSYMNKAIELAKKGIGFVNPDPLVGAVVIKGGKIIGSGYHKAYNSSSAEVDAFNNISQELHGAEIYINLEPDANSIITSGIKKVYIGMLHPVDKGRNVELLRAAGIEVEINILKCECEELNEISTHYLPSGTPFVFTSWSMTLDGKLASKTGDSRWVSGEDSLKFVHHLRQRVAAIMVGENTVRLDDPMLTTRLEGVEISNPLRVILSTYGDISMDAKVLKVNKDTKTIVIVSNNISLEKEEQLLKKGVEVLKLKETLKKIDFKDIVKALGDRGIDSLYIEGGSGVFASAFESGVVNVVYATIAPKIIGGKNAVSPVGGIGIERMRDAIILKRVTHEIVGSDVIFKGYV
ncbi:bifunctional diaminohydroxyphosphoribosylaminopyrimidine deaminase/5-amino-6-(5-phosphoribosylamino)uracil reductase RibD [Clostridium estertheticum]|uniref:bifunctional diaminohydroxyphosphoribosylaminopyrimidine deaminase/5-amino-6-(5-phosphoribosylamino)uracil reductase RibD n=1 Tax=Clostridium estertheticum TaxID=238834 RepID=UPI0013E93C0E|nr:bifunctional diaminohydroxyphosphoribosylaminopyrimidine deaminase/5-amino-6-(5-phosphoribosylamino)uracil reductase RibD [Clostridium estertheticum]MBZ9686575.1 bifunctional diaminohydroxyphosphoribosylaminopyrimidine deaminase/5-amino-6-(5-phosphoribosylamino)uracil reductase RibD [Clostridium estertheticum]